MLYGLTDWIVSEYFDVRGRLERFRAITLAGHPLSDEARALAGSNGMVGFLLGLPLFGDDIDAHVYARRFYEDLPVSYADDVDIGIFPVKPLTCDEYEWARQRGDTGPPLLAEKFLERGDAHRTWIHRPSVLRESKEEIGPG